jgi:RNA polymerase sigma factor (sigma-70 family)
LSAITLDSLYEAYKNASADQKEVAREALILGMYRESWPIIYSRLHGAYPDIVSDAVSKAILNLEKFRGEARFSTWYYKIVMNFCNMALREMTLQPEEISLDALDDGAEPMTDPVHQNDVKLDLTTVLSGVTAEERALLKLRHAGFTYPEISEKLGQSESTLRVRMHRLTARIERGKKVRAARSRLAAGSAKSRFDQ